MDRDVEVYFLPMMNLFLILYVELIKMYEIILCINIWAVTVFEIYKNISIIVLKTFKYLSKYTVSVILWCKTHIINSYKCFSMNFWKKYAIEFGFSLEPVRNCCFSLGRGTLISLIPSFTISLLLVDVSVSLKIEDKGGH